MADRFPLVVASSTVQELSSGDNLDLSNNGVVGLSTIGVGTVYTSDIKVTDQLIVTAAPGGHKVAFGTEQSSTLSADTTILDVFGDSFFDGAIGIGTTNAFAGIGTTTGVGFGTVRLAVAGDMRVALPGISTSNFYGAPHLVSFSGINTSFGQYPGMNDSGISPEGRVLTRGVQSQVTYSVLDINSWNRQQYFGSSQYRIPDPFRAFTLKNDPDPRINSGSGIFGNNQFYNAVGMGFHVVPNYGGSDYWAYNGYVVEPSRDRLVWGSNTAPAYSGIPAGISREAMTLVLNQGRLGIGTTAPSTTLHVQGAATITGALSKGSGTFNIPHPVAEGKRLVHSFIEGPRADLIYRGTVALSSGTATVNIDEVVGLTAGTWAALCREPQLFLQNNEDWTQVKGSVSAEGVITIEAKTSTSTANIDWMVVAERKDTHMYDIGWTDENGRPILEPDDVNASEVLKNAPVVDLDNLEASFKDS